MNMNIKRLLAAASLFAGSLHAQSLPSLTRSLVTNGLNDSTLTLVSDSARRTRAATLLQVRKALSLSAFDSLFTTNLRLTGGSITGSPTATFGAITVSSCTGCGGGGGSVTVSDTVKLVTFDSVRAVLYRAGNGAAATPAYSFSGNVGTGIWRVSGDTVAISTNGTRRWSVAANQLLFTTPMLGPNGALNTPTYGFSSLPNTGIYALTGDTLAVQAGAQALRISLGVITGGSTVNTLIINASTGNSKKMRLTTTSSSGTSFDAIGMNELQQVKIRSGSATNPTLTFQVDTTTGLFNAGTTTTDTVFVSVNGIRQAAFSKTGILLLQNLPSEGSTKNAMCWDGVTFNVTQNAAATCTVSSRRYKTDIQSLPLDVARNAVSKLRATSYTEKSGGRKAIGVIAEEADSVDHRLASRDNKGLINSTNYEEITVLLLKVVQDQQRQLDSLKTALKARKP